VNLSSILFFYFLIISVRGRHGRDRMVVRFTITNAISA